MTIVSDETYQEHVVFVWWVFVALGWLEFLLTQHIENCVSFQAAGGRRFQGFAMVQTAAPPPPPLFTQPLDRKQGLTIMQTCNVKTKQLLNCSFRSKSTDNEKKLGSGFIRDISISISLSKKTIVTWSLRLM